MNLLLKNGIKVNEEKLGTTLATLNTHLLINRMYQTDVSKLGDNINDSTVVIQSRTNGNEINADEMLHETTRIHLGKHCQSNQPQLEEGVDDVEDDDNAQIENRDRFDEVTLSLDNQNQKIVQTHCLPHKSNLQSKQQSSFNEPSLDQADLNLSQRRRVFNVRTLSDGAGPSPSPPPPSSSSSISKTSVIQYLIPHTISSPLKTNFRDDSLTTIINKTPSTSSSCSLDHIVQLNKLNESIVAKEQVDKPSPVRPSILKSNQFAFGNIDTHRRTCPQSHFNSRRRNMSADQPTTKLCSKVTTYKDNRSQFSSWRPSRRRLFHNFSEDDKYEDYEDEYHYKNDYTQCTCNLAQTEKSVHILTPTKSEEILFDPTKSAASSIVNHHHPHHHLPQQHVDRIFKGSLNIKSNQGNLSLQQLYKPMEQLNSLVESPQPVSLNSCSSDMIDESHSLTPLINCVADHKHKCEIDFNRSNSSNCSNMDGSQSTDILYFDDDDSSPYRNTIYGCNDSIPLKGTDVSYSTLNDFPDQLNLADETSTDIDDDDTYEDDSDNPHYCKKCNIWFGSLDPSYPFKCNCHKTGTDTMNTYDTQSVYSVHMQKDFRYYLQHPYSRLFVAYFVVFCNFLIFAEDPLSHSLRECSIPILGNVISFLFTKYPSQFEWQLFKGGLGFIAVVFGLICGKYFFHHFLLRRMLRLKMFRDESGTWMIMLISMVIICFCFSKVYNIILRMFHPDPTLYLINSRTGISYASFMKIAACGTWCGDFFTAWMITDMMLQDNLYPDWCRWLRCFWHRHTTIRIVIFWSGALVIASTVITIILTDWICWDNVNQTFFSTTELSRAFLACAILFMDLMIVMQDWDFPHFVSDLNIKLPGLLQPSYTFNFCQKSLKFPEFKIKISGKWFNYGIIVFVMMLDLNMWKNQIIYRPEDFGQYVDPVLHNVYTINETEPLKIDPTDPESFNYTIWTFETRKACIDKATNQSCIHLDSMIKSRYLGYPAMVKALSFIPIACGFVFFFVLTYLYGRFPPKTDKSIGGRLKKRSTMHKSSWRRERRDSRGGHVSWPGITVYTDAKRLARLNRLLNSNEQSLATMSPCRPTYTLPRETNMINPSSIMQSFNSDQNCLSNPYNSSNTVSYVSSSPRTTAQNDQLFSNYLPRFIPQFNGQLLWSTIVSVLSPSSSVRKSTSNTIDLNHPDGTTMEWIPIDNELNNSQMTMNQSKLRAATFVTLPPFQPGTMLQFQTQVVQLPVVVSDHSEPARVS